MVSGRVVDDCHLRRSPITAAQEMTHKLVRCHDAGPRSCATCLYIGAKCFPQLPQRIAIEFSIHCLSWWNKFLMHDAFNVKKQTKIELKLLRTCCAFFGRSEVGVFH